MLFFSTPVFSNRDKEKEFEDEKIRTLAIIKELKDEQIRDAENLRRATGLLDDRKKDVEDQKLRIQELQRTVDEQEVESLAHLDQIQNHKKQAIGKISLALSRKEARCEQNDAIRGAIVQPGYCVTSNAMS